MSAPKWIWDGSLGCICGAHGRVVMGGQGHRLAELDVLVIDPLGTGARDFLLLVEARRVARHAVLEELALQMKCIRSSEC